MNDQGRANADFSTALKIDPSLQASLQQEVGNIQARQAEEAGARGRRLAERVLDEVSFTAPDRSGEAITIDRAFVTRNVGDLAKDADLSRFIL